MIIRQNNKIMNTPVRFIIFILFFCLKPACHQSDRDNNLYYDSEELEQEFFKRMDGDDRNVLYRKNEAISKVMSFEFVVSPGIDKIGEFVTFSVLSLVKEDEIKSYLPTLQLGDSRFSAIASSKVKTYSGYSMVKIDFKIPNDFIFPNNDIIIIDGGSESILVGDVIRNDLKEMVVSHSGRANNAVLIWGVKLEQYK